MKLRFFIPVILIITMNGWSSSRFFIRLNGSDVGTLVETRQMDRKAGTIRVESVSRITLKRGGATVTLSENSVEISRLDGTPISLSVKADQAGLKTEFHADFSKSSAQLHYDASTRRQALPPDVVLGYGSEIRISRLLKSTATTTSFHFFSSDTQNVMTRTVRKLRKEKGDSDKTYRLELKDSSGNTELKQEILVDESGQLLYTKSRMMGLSIEFVSKNASSDGKAETGKSTDILIQTLFHAKEWFPSNFDVQTITILVKAGNQPVTISQGDFQSVARKGDGVLVTITRSKLTNVMKADRKAAALKSGPIVQSDLPEIQKIVTDLRRGGTTDAGFVRKVVHKVYRMIDRKGYGVGFANTATILKTGEGDCTEHTVLAMALLRAGGIPCRAAAGVVAVNGTIGYHMWPQVSMDGKWISIDPTLNEETADPSHLIMAHTLLNDTGFQRDLLPIVQQIGTLSVEPVSVTFRDKAVFSQFGTRRAGNFLEVDGIGFGINPGEDFQWIPVNRQDSMDRYRLGTMVLKGGLRIPISLADGKNRKYLTCQAENLISSLAPLSRETILGYPVVLGRDDGSLAMVLAYRGTLFRFTFSSPSATMGTELKERAYNICLKLLANVKRNDSDR
ncbi:MAG: transglutaminase domain-containing protein [Acidobacteria bacterium]|nr:transglutaminase domain-containing protein [Acidobacteriota bacterium]